MNYLTPAQASAQFLSLIVFAAAARWYVVPWLKNRTRADALIALRAGYSVVQLASVDYTGFPANYHWPTCLHRCPPAFLTCRCTMGVWPSRSSPPPSTISPVAK